MSAPVVDDVSFVGLGIADDDGDDDDDDGQALHVGHNQAVK